MDDGHYYAIEISEWRRKTVAVLASSKDEALRKAMTDYAAINQGLDHTCIDSTDFDVDD